MSSFRAFFRLPAADRLLLLQAAVWVVAIRLALRFLFFELVRRLVTCLAKAPVEPQQLDLTAPDRVAWALALAGQLLPGNTNCLAHALAGQLLLGRRGFRTRLHIGLAKSKEGTVEGHAWLECEHRVVIGDNGELARFAPLASLRQR